MPVVVVESDEADGLPTVSVDQVTGARLAVEHLLELGHETVWHLSGPRDWLEARDRVDGLAAGARRTRDGGAAGHRRGLEPAIGLRGGPRASARTT